jgi:geranylgeranylglycerol-phosphate geranylgeranyltransferase
MTAYLRLLRPGNLLILAGAILLGRALAAGASGTAAARPIAAWSVVAACLLVGSFYVWNDWADRIVDRVNRPARPIPSGGVAPRGAAIFAFVLTAAAFGAAAAAGGAALLVLGVWTLLLVAYEVGLKRTGLPGNILVSTVAASSLLFGARLGGSVAAGAAPALFAFFLHLGREIVKDIADEAGDREGARRTLPMAIGVRGALLVSALPLALLVLLSPLPFLLGIYNVFYLVIVLVGVDLLLAFAFARCLRRPDRSNLGLLSHLLKGQMVIGMAAMLVGSVA